MHPRRIAPTDRANEDAGRPTEHGPGLSTGEVVASPPCGGVTRIAFPMASDGGNDAHDIML